MKVPEDFKCQIVKLGSELLIYLKGDLDMHTTTILQETIHEYSLSIICLITIDCDKVLYVDSAFLQFLTNLSRQVRTVRVVNASRTIKKIFELTGLDQVYLADAA